MLTFKVYFRISLFPEGVKGFHFEEKEIKKGVTYGEFVEDYEVFDEYLCTERQSKYVINELSYIYSRYHADTVTNLKYENDGKFTCKITLNSDDWITNQRDDDDELTQYIEELLWPGDIHCEGYMFVRGAFYYVQMEVDYISDWVDEDEDEDDKFRKN